MTFKYEVFRRIAEAPAVIQWLKIVQDKHSSNLDVNAPLGGISGPGRMPEKEFLLTQSARVNPNLPHLLIDNPYVAMWKGTYFLLDYDALQGNKPRFKIRIAPFLMLIQKYDSRFAAVPASQQVSLPPAVILPGNVGHSGGGF